MEARNYFLETDSEALHHLKINLSRDDPGYDDFPEHKWLEQEIHSDKNLITEQWVVEQPGKSGELIAHAWVRLYPGFDCQEVTANIAVLPKFRRQGIGTILLKRIVEYAKSLGVKTILIFTYPLSQNGTSFLKKNSFLPAGNYTKLVIQSTHRIPPVIVPVGYILRPYNQVDDLGILTQAINESYSGLWGHEELTQDLVNTLLLKYSTEGIFVLFSERGKAAGICRSTITDNNGHPTGHIDAPGIISRHRRLDLFRALILTGLHWLRSKNLGWIEVESWGDNPATLEMYGELGFQVQRKFTEYGLGIEGKILSIQGNSSKPNSRENPGGI